MLLSSEAGDAADIKLFVVASLVEGEKLCLRVPRPITDGANTLSRERGSCI